MALYMQNLMKQAGQEIPGSKPILEINPGHPVIQRLDQEEDNTKVKDWSEILLDQAVLAEGGQLEDPARFVSRLNGLMMELAG
jgi:molecular chaperone HtpG